MKRKSKQICVTLPPDTARLAVRAAGMHGVSVSGWIATLVAIELGTDEPNIHRKKRVSGRKKI